MYGIAIIGAGPGGSARAKLLGWDYIIAVVGERELLSGSAIQQTCGGGLPAPDTRIMPATLSHGKGGS